MLHASPAASPGLRPSPVPDDFQVTPPPPDIPHEGTSQSRKCQPKHSRNKKLMEVLDFLAQLKWSPVQVLIELLQSQSDDFSQHQQGLFRTSNILTLLNLLWQTTEGHPLLTDWMMRGPALEVVCNDIDKGMECSKKEMLMEIKDVSLKYLENFSINSIVEQAPIPTSWKAVLDAATHGPRTDENTRKSTRLVSTLLPLKFTIPIVVRERISLPRKPYIFNAAMCSMFNSGSVFFLGQREHHDG